MSPGTLISNDDFEEKNYNVYGLQRSENLNKKSKSGQINVRRNLERDLMENAATPRDEAPEDKNHSPY